MAAWAKIHPTFDMKLWKDIDVKNEVRFSKQNINLYNSLSDPRARSDILRLQILYQF